MLAHVMMVVDVPHATTKEEANKLVAEWLDNADEINAIVNYQILTADESGNVDVLTKP